MKCIIYQFRNISSVGMALIQISNQSTKNLGKKINFFDKEALTTTLPAQLSLKFQLNIVPVFIERKNDDTFNIEFLVLFF